MGGRVSGATAIRRGGPSAPLRWLLERALVVGGVLDYVCGHGEDVAHLRSLGYAAVGYDPQWRPHAILAGLRFNTVLCTFVLNVLDAATAAGVVYECRRRLHPGGYLYASVRSDVQGFSAGRRAVQREAHPPGGHLLTTRGSFRLYRFGSEL